MNADLEMIQAFAERHPAGVARVLEQSEPKDAALLLERLPAESVASVLLDMVPLFAARLLERLAIDLCVAALGELPLNAAAALLRRTSDQKRNELLESLGQNPRARSLSELLSHPPDTAGALMDPLVLALTEELNVERALAQLRRESEHAMYYVYVVGDGGRLVGVANQRELMLAAPDAPLSSIMTPDPDSLFASAGREAIASHPAWQRVHALPVVDKNGIFLGAIRYEIVRRVERDLGRGEPGGEAEATARALAELYGLGLGGLVEWASSAVRGPRSRGRARGSR